MLLTRYLPLSAGVCISSVFVFSFNFSQSSRIPLITMCSFNMDGNYTFQLHKEALQIYYTKFSSSLGCNYTVTHFYLAEKGK